MIEVEQGEQILRVVRKHWFVLLGDIFMLVFAVALPVVLLFVFNILPIEKIFAFSGSTFAAGGFFLTAWLTIVWMMGWNIWTDYYLDVLLFTDKRIFDIEQKGLFRRKSASFRIDRIQNVVVDQKGIIQTLLNFGSIGIETAGGRDDFNAEYIARPYEIKKLINQMQDGALEKSQQVHLHPETLGRIAPQTGDSSEGAPEELGGSARLGEKSGV